MTGDWSYQYKILSFTLTGDYEGVFSNDGKLDVDPVDGLALCRVDQRWIDRGKKPERWKFYENRICAIFLMDEGFEVADQFSNFIGLKKKSETLEEFHKRRS